MSAAQNIPTDVAHLTPQWLTQTLREHGHEVVVEHADATLVGSGQMAASYRLSLRYRNPTALPTSMIAKLATGSEEHRRFGSGAFRNEIRFYRDLADTVRAPVPHSHGAVVSESGSEFVLLLEDLAPARQGDQIAGCTVEQARAVAVAAAGLHGPRWNDQTLLDNTLSLPSAEDRELMESVLAPMAEVFCDRLTDRLTDLERSAVAWLVATAGEWLITPVRHFALLHGDLRIDNVMFGQDNAVTLVDWQTITPGNPLRDIAFLLSTSLPTEDRRACERNIVGDYHRALLEHGVRDYSVEECWQDYASSLIQAPLIIVFGCGAAQPTQRGDTMFHTMLTRSATAINDLVPGVLG
ncbi:phosphotransferase [Nocardia callitridis]|uniref:Phosphotransferase n=1 Tax=Nocardia callitridis TaxID=648753 RepID=A0ABP9KAK9_9NOCA